MATDKIRAFVLAYQREHNIPDWQMCNMLCMDEPDWQNFAHDHGATLTIFQQIMFISETGIPLPD